MGSQCGSSTAVEMAVANNKTQWLDDPHDGVMHHDVPASPFFPLDTPHPSKAFYYIKTIMLSKVDLDAIKWMLYSNLHDNSLHPSSNEPSTMDDLVATPSTGHPFQLNLYYKELSQSQCY